MRCWRASPSASAPVPSGELSSTTTSSSARLAEAALSNSARTSSASRSRSLYVGTIIVRSGAPDEVTRSTIIHVTPARMTPPSARTSNALAWTLAMLLLVAARLPAIAQPAGNDQHLYLYTGQRVFEGAVPYVDAWDQKPPGIFFLYGALWQVWPRESVVAVADLGVAAITAWLLVALGRRTGDVTAGRLAAVIYLAGSHPSLARLSGAYIRGQCEVFVAMFVTAAMVFTASSARTRVGLFLAGLCLGAAFLVKYNAAAYALPVVVALTTRDRTDDERQNRRRMLFNVTTVAL